MKTNLPLNFLIALAWITGLNLLALAIRDMVLANKIYNFLLWNLFLGFVPLLIAGLLHYFQDKLPKLALLFGSLLWLLFYPNAPYMISDLIHVNPNSPVALYDTLIIFSFAMLSLYYGLSSIKIVHALYRQMSGARVARLVLWASILLSSFGIYLGRILRLNSWDVFSDPLKVMHMVFDHLFPISKNPATYVIIVLFSALQFMLLTMMKDIQTLEKSSNE